MRKSDAETANDAATDRLAIPRRDFLRLSSVAAVGVAASAFAEGSVVGSAAGALLARPMPLLGVGYWDGSFAEPSTHRPVAADRLSSGDRKFLDGGARLRVAGFWRADAQKQPLSFSVNVHYPAPDVPDGRAPFIAWSYSSLRLGSKPIAFNVPVTDSVEMSVDAAVPSNSVVRALRNRVLDVRETTRDESFLRLDVGGSRSAAKLRRGVYFVAVRESDDQKAPDWASLRVVSPEGGKLTAGGAGPLVADTLFGSRPVPFSYVVVSADYVAT